MRNMMPGWTWNPTPEGGGGGTSAYLHLTGRIREAPTYMDQTRIALSQIQARPP